MSKIIECEFFQKPLTPMSPLRSGSIGAPVVPVAFGVSQSVWICGLLETTQGLRARVQILPHSGATSLRWCRMRPPLLHFMAWLAFNAWSYPSHFKGSLRGMSLKRSRRLSRNSSSERTVPLRMLGRVLSHPPVSFHQPNPIQSKRPKIS